MKTAKTGARMIAERVLYCAEDPDAAVTVKLFAPTFQAKTNAHVCKYQIIGRGVEITRYASGIDAFQALQCAMVIIGGEITRIEQMADIHLLFSDLGNFGFPAP